MWLMPQPLCCKYGLFLKYFTYMPGIRSETFGCAVVLVDAVVFIKCWAKLVPSVLFLVITKARRNLAMYFERGFHENPNVSHQNNILCEADSVSNWMNHFHEKNCCLVTKHTKRCSSHSCSITVTYFTKRRRILSRDLYEHEQKAKYVLVLRESFF